MCRSIRLPFWMVFLGLVLFVDCKQQLFAQSTVFTNGVQDKRPGYYAFTNLTLYVDYQTKFVGATLLVKDGVIVSAGTNISIPNGVVVEDLGGSYVYPSFIDLYTDFGLPEVPKVPFSHSPQYTSNKPGPFSWNQAIRPEVNAIDYFKYNDSKAAEWRGAGFGTVLTHIKDGISRGTSVVCLLSDGRDTDMVLASKASAHFSFSKGSSAQEYPSSLMGAIALLRQTFYDAEWYSKGFSNEINLSLQALNLQKGLPLFFETGNKLSVLRAAKLGKEFGHQFIIKGSGDEYQMLKEIKETKSRLVLPLNFPKAFDVDDPFVSNQLTWSQLKHWEMSALNPGFLAREGIDFTLTLSDLPDKKEFFKNLRLSVKYGLPESAALKSLTYLPASFIRLENKIGQLKPGYLANFIITSGNIFEEGTIVYENWVKGKRHIVNERPVNDFRGKYLLKVDQFPDWKLIVRGKKENPEVSVYETDSIIHKTSFIWSGSSVSISILRKRDSLVEDLRLTGNYSNRNLEGFGTDDNGKRWRWRAIYTDTVKLPTTPVSTPLDSSIFKSSIKYPFVGFGYDKPPRLESVLIKNATLYTGTDKGVLSQIDILLVDGKIKQISKSINNLSAKTINGTGKFVTAGIIDEHSHIAGAGGLNEIGKSITAEVRFGDVLDHQDINIFRQLAGGVVAVQLLHGSANCIGGQSSLIKLRWGESPEKMKIAGADGFIKFALGENVKQSNWGDGYTVRYPQTRMGVEQTIGDAFLRAKVYDQEWKAYNSSKGKLTSPRKDLELEAIAEILNNKRHITCHSYVQSEINMLMHLADSLGFKVNTFTHILEGYKVADKMAKHGSNGSTFADWWAYKMEVMDAIPQNAFIMSKNGVNTAINSDDPEMARRLNQEAAKSIKYTGMDPQECWKMVTINPAKALHLDKRMGSLEVGKDADIVIWSNDPLSIYGVPEYTFVDGICYFDRSKVLEMKSELEKEKTRIIKKMLVAKRGGELVQPLVPKKTKNYDCEAFESTYDE